MFLELVGILFFCQRRKHSGWIGFVPALSKLSSAVLTTGLHTGLETTCVWFLLFCTLESLGIPHYKLMLQVGTGIVARDVGTKVQSHHGPARLPEINLDVGC